MELPAALRLPSPEVQALTDLLRLSELLGSRVGQVGTLVEYDQADSRIDQLTQWDQDARSLLEQYAPDALESFDAIGQFPDGCADQTCVAEALNLLQLKQSALTTVRDSWMQTK